MTDLSPIAFAPLMFEHNYLSAPILGNDPSYNLGIRHDRGANLDPLIIGRYQDLVD
jgi:hypothetical protein